MAQYSRVIHSTRQRYRTGSVSACFVWPSNEVTPFAQTHSGLGDVVTVEQDMPNWRYRIAHGQSATTTFEARELYLTYTPGHLFLGKWCPSAQRWGYYQYDGDLFVNHSTAWVPPNAPPSSIDPKTRDEALSRAIRDARSKQNHFRGGNFIAELRDTIRGLRNPVKGFRDLLDTYHRNGRKRVKRAVGRRTPPVSQEQFRQLERDAPNVARAAQKALSDSWLEANFGWSPLLSDAVDAYHALRRLSATTPLARFFGQSDREDPPTYANGVRVHEISDLLFNARTNIRWSVKYYGAVKINVDEPTGRAVEEMGVRARDFLPAVWEAIPYSFLVDYFANVGEIIEAVSFPRSDIAWAAQTIRNHAIRSTERTVFVEASSPSYPSEGSNKVFAFSPPRVEWDRRYVFRTKYTGSFVPSLRFEIPGSKNWRKWCNVAALARLRTL